MRKLSIRLFAVLSVITIAVVFWRDFWERPLCAQASQDIQASQIPQLIRELGDENYHVRENASEKLKKLGVKAASALQKAVQDPDVEISERAKELLRFVEFHWVRPTDAPQIRQIMEQYADATSTQEKLEPINRLSDWSSDYLIRKGEGINALCRILQFEQDQLVRAEAIRAIVAVPPVNAQQRKRWFTAVEEFFEKTENDPLVQMTMRFVETRYKALEYREKTLFDDPPQPPDNKLVEQVRQVADEFRKFRENDEYYNERRGSDYDLLLFYALAELHDAVRLKDEANTLVLQALDTNPIISDEGVSQYMPHYMTAEYLHHRHLNLWAKDAYLFVAQKDIHLRSESNFWAAMQFEYLGDNAKALEMLEQVARAIKDTTNPANAFFSRNSHFVNSKIKLLSAQLALDREELSEAQKLLDEAIKFRTGEIDVDILIARYQLMLKIEEKENKSELELSEDEKKEKEKFKEKTQELINRSLAASKTQMSNFMNINEPNESYSMPYNQTAWLLANTDGEYELALNSAKRAMFLSSDAPNVVDTLAHVYALGKEYDKAVETQKLAVKLAPQTVIFQDVLKKFKTLREKTAKNRP